MKITDNDRISISIFEMIQYDLNLFNKNIATISSNPEHIKAYLDLVYAKTLSFGNLKKLYKHMKSIGINNNYLEYFNEEQLRKVGLALYYFNNEFDKIENKTLLTSKDIVKMIETNSKKAKVKKLYYKSCGTKTDVKTLKDYFNDYINNNNFSLVMDNNIYQNSFIKNKKEYKEAIYNFSLQFCDYDLDTKKEILVALNKGFYNSMFASNRYSEPITFIKEDSFDAIAPIVYSFHAQKLNIFTNLSSKKVSIYSKKEMLEFAEETGNKIREKLFSLRKLYPELSLEFTDQILFPKYKKLNKIAGVNYNQPQNKKIKQNEQVM